MGAEHGLCHTARFEQAEAQQHRIAPVSYTHLDVYKRQDPDAAHIVFLLRRRLVGLFGFLWRRFLSGTICHIRFAEGAVRIDLASGAFFGAGADNGRILAVVLQQRHQVGFVHGI